MHRISIDAKREERAMRRLQVGVIGLGEIGGAHCASIATLPQAQLVAVADLRSEVAATIAGRYGATAYGSAEELLAHPGLEAGTCARRHLAVPLYPIRPN